VYNGVTSISVTHSLWPTSTIVLFRAFPLNVMMHKGTVIGESGFACHSKCLVTFSMHGATHWPTTKMCSATCRRPWKWVIFPHNSVKMRTTRPKINPGCDYMWSMWQKIAPECSKRIEHRIREPLWYVMPHARQSAQSAEPTPMTTVHSSPSSSACRSSYFHNPTGTSPFWQFEHQHRQTRSLTHTEFCLFFERQ